MDRELSDNVIDAAAKELMVDAPEELLKGVMYRIEKDAAPKKRFAVGRFTAFGAVAAAILIFITIQPNLANLTGGNTAMDNAAPAPAADAAPAPQAMPEAASIIEGRSLDTADAGALPAEDEAGGGETTFAAPPELSPLEQALHDWTHLRVDELVSVSEISRDESHITATVVYESETLEVTVTEENGQFVVSSSVVQE